MVTAHPRRGVVDAPLPKNRTRAVDRDRLPRFLDSRFARPRFLDSRLRGDRADDGAENGESQHGDDDDGVTVVVVVITRK